jgi:predicted MPP superfamily phosphohydrolase
MFRHAVGFEWNRVRLPVPELPPPLSGLKIAHLSDLHLRGFWSKAYDQLIDRIETAQPDLVLITGDFIDDKHDHRPALPILKRFIPRLKARLGVFGILGNHDVDFITPYLAELGVNMIEAGFASLQADGDAKIELIGLPGVSRADLDAYFITSLPSKAPGALRIVLSHYPDHVRRVRPLRADLFLAGHTHGGQCCLPGGWPIIKHDALPRRLCRGVNRYDGTWLVVSRGLGFAGFLPARVFCPAEAIEITLVTR